MTTSRQYLLGLLFVLAGLSGCGGSDAGPPAPPVTPAKPQPQADTTAPTVAVALGSMQRQLDSTSPFGYVDAVALEIAASDDVGVVKLVETVEGVSLTDGSSVLSATFDEAPVAQPSDLATLHTTAFPLGKYSVVLHAFDAAGHQSDSPAVTFYVCQGGPSPTNTAGLVCSLPG